MKFCLDHWDQLRAAIDGRGLTALVSDGGAEAAHRMRRELAGETSIDSFDPLMGAHNLIVSNAMQTIADVGGDPLVLLAPDAPDDVQCPVCYLNTLARRHDQICEDPDCSSNGLRFEWMLARAADDMVARWRQLGEEDDR